MDVFLLDKSEYKRDLDIVGNARKLSASYLHLKTGKPLQDCEDFVLKQTSEGGLFALKPVLMHVLKRQPNQDRVKGQVTFDKLIENVTKTESILSPNLIVYDNPKVNKSITGNYIDGKTKARKVIKKRGIEAQQQGLDDIFAICNNAEYSIKLFINSISGAHCSPYNPLFNKTAHSTLTSTCRIMVSYSNSSSECFISGNRHYWSKKVVIENILSIINNTDYDQLHEVITKYDMVIPTVIDVVNLINRCTKFYWINREHQKDIYDLVSKLSGYQRAAFVYTGDLYHIAKFNDSLVRNLLAEIIVRPEEYPIDADDVIKNADEMVAALVGIFCSDLIRGDKISDLKGRGNKDYETYARTIDYVTKTIIKYKDFFRTFFITNNAPPSIYEFPSSIRRNVVGSDTDSTMFTVQDWVEWYFGKLSFGFEVNNITNLICYFNAQVIGHMMALASKQMGVTEDELFTLQMKNEYAFAIYMRANRAKHYATMITSREGVVYKKPKIDIKGVGLKDSKIPKNIMNKLEGAIEIAMDGLMSGQGIDIYPLMQKIANLEHVITRSLEEGKIEYLSTVNISGIGSYKKPMSSKYMHYDLWEKVFSNKYGQIALPPYRAVKITTKIDNKREFINWVDSLDVVISTPLKEWMAVNNKTGLGGNLLLPYELFEGGLPKDFVNTINIRSIVSELVAGFYIVLEMTGMYVKNKNSTMLLHDDIPYREEFGLPGDN